MTNFKFISILKILQYTLLLHETVSNNNTSGIREKKKKRYQSEDIKYTNRLKIYAMTK